MPSRTNRKNKREVISQKIALLIREGKPRNQAVAIANSMWRRGEL